VDPLGLDDLDRRVLSTIIEKFGGGPVGLETIAASISEESDTIMDVVEPYLLQLGFLDPAATTGVDVGNKGVYELKSPSLSVGGCVIAIHHCLLNKKHTHTTTDLGSPCNSSGRVAECVDQFLFSAERYGQYHAGGLSIQHANHGSDGYRSGGATQRNDCRIGNAQHCAQRDALSHFDAAAGRGGDCVALHLQPNSCAHPDVLCGECAEFERPKASGALHQRSYGCGAGREWRD
jgi:hypothetical protein